MRVTEASRDLVRALMERLSKEPVEVVIATLLVSFTILRNKLHFSLGQIVEGCNKGNEMVAFMWQEHENREDAKRKTAFRTETFH